MDSDFFEVASPSAPAEKKRFHGEVSFRVMPSDCGYPLALSFVLRGMIEQMENEGNYVAYTH